MFITPTLFWLCVIGAFLIAFCVAVSVKGPKGDAIASIASLTGFLLLILPLIFPELAMYVDAPAPPP